MRQESHAHPLSFVHIRYYHKIASFDTKLDLIVCVCQLKSSLVALRLLIYVFCGVELDFFCV